MQCLCVYTHPVHLHLCQYGHQRHLYIVEQRLCPDAFQFGFQLVFQLQGDVSIFSGILANHHLVHIAHRLLVFPLRSYQFFNVYGLVVQMDFCHVVHVVVQFGLYQVVSYHGVEHLPLHLDAVAGKHLNVVFHVLTHLEQLLTLVGRSQQFECAESFFSVLADGHIKSLSLCHCKAQTYQFGTEGIGGCGLCIKTQRVFCQEIFTDFPYIFFFLNELIIMWLVFNALKIQNLLASLPFVGNFGK